MNEVNKIDASGENSFIFIASTFPDLVYIKFVFSAENISSTVLELAKQQSQELEDREIPLFGGDLVASIDIVSK